MLTPLAQQEEAANTTPTRYILTREAMGKDIVWLERSIDTVSMEPISPKFRVDLTKFIAPESFGERMKGTGGAIFEMQISSSDNSTIS